MTSVIVGKFSVVADIVEPGQEPWYMLLHLGPCVEVSIELHPFDVGELQADGLPIPPAVQVRALIDTGASMTVIHTDVFRSLQPTVYAFTALRGVHSDESRKCPNFRALVSFPNTSMPAFAAEAVADRFTAKENDVRAILGRDFLRTRKLVYEGRHGRFTVSDED